MSDTRDRIAAALRALLAAGDEAGVAALAIAESLAGNAEFDVDDLRRRGLLAAPGGAAGLLVSSLPFGLATPLDRPRLRRDAYRFAAATGADEGTAVACVAAALVAADLTRFDASTTAIRVRQSLLEDAPMALLNQFQLRAPDTPPEAVPVDDAGAALQMALSATAWRDGDGVTATLSALGDGAGSAATALAAAFAGLRARTCDAPLDGDAAQRADTVAERLTERAASLA
ncbi:MAG: hypothetical protein ACYDAC_06745 [Candidatus Dormibacteria bacterium]